MGTPIGSLGNFLSWNGSGSAYLTAGFTVDNTYSSGSTPIVLTNGQTFDGKGHTITISNGAANFNGLFILRGGTIQHLQLNVTSAVLANECGWLVYGIDSASVTGAYGIVYNVYVNASAGGSIGTNNGGIVGARAGVRSNGSSYVTGSSTYNLNVIDSKYYGPISSGGGGILGKYSSNVTGLNDGSNGGGTILIENCVVIASALGIDSGGIVGSFMGKDYNGNNNNIKKCIVVGSPTGNSTGGFVATDSYCNITDSYSLYNMTGTNSGGFYQKKAHGTISTSYYLGTFSGSNTNSFISEETIGDSAITISNCATSGTSFGTSGNITTAGTNLTSYTTGTSNTTEPINSFNGVIWNKTPQPPILAGFTNTAKWSGYSAYTDNPGVVFSTDTFSAGDPHIYPLDGNKYNLDMEGPFKLFDNNHKNRMIINGLIENGDGRFKKLQYIRKIYICHDNKNILVDLGFRGKPVKILNNNNFDYVETQLEFSKPLMYCNKCRFTSKDIENNKHDIEGHTFVPLIRNKIELNILVPDDNLYKITLSNVGENNVNPCRISIELLINNENKLKNYVGAYVRNENIDDIRLDNIYEIKNNVIKTLLL